MIAFVHLDNLAEIDSLKKAYLASLVAPLDGYWQAAIIDPAPHWALVVNGRHLINLGSVSNPKAPDLRASYALLTADQHGYTIQYHYVEYDRQAVIAALEKIRHPGRAFLSKFMRGGIHPQG